MLFLIGVGSRSALSRWSVMLLVAVACSLPKWVRCRETAGGTRGEGLICEIAEGRCSDNETIQSKGASLTLYMPCTQFTTLGKVEIQSSSTT